MNLKTTAALLLVLGAAAPLFAADPADTAPAQPRVKLKPEGAEETLPDTVLIDQPTASVLDYGSASLRTRFSSGGTMLNYFSVGVLERFNIGASLDVDQLIGTATPVRLRAPAVQLQYRFYDGTRHLPAIAAGFDGQGYFYNQQRHEYSESKRGLYVVGSQEVGVPGLWIHPGLNISDFDANAIYGFAGISFNIEDRVTLMGEWDNVRNLHDSRLNTGIRFQVTSNFQASFDIREVAGTGAFSDGTRHANERIAQLRYVSSF